MQYKKCECAICHKETSSGGAAFVAHMRFHVRRKEAVEHKQGKKLRFLRIDQDITTEQPYAFLGEDPLPGQPKGVWELPDLKKEYIPVDPAAYFITSGEAVKKADKLVQDSYAMASKCRALRDKLKKARGVNKYLETCRNDGRLIVKQKNPRVKSNGDDNENEQN